MNRFYRPSSIRKKTIYNRPKKVAGASILLANGGSGSASFYNSPQEYHDTIHNVIRKPKKSGSGIGGTIEHKLQQLKLKPSNPKKSQTIKFNL
jgi:hypothetical protein